MQGPLVVLFVLLSFSGSAQQPADVAVIAPSVHTFKVSKTHENYAVKVEANAYNLLNQRSAVGFNENILATGLISPNRAKRFSGDPGIDWAKIMTGFNAVDALNGTGAFGGTVPGKSTLIQSPLTLSNQYGLGNIFQTARQFRFAVRFVF